MTKKKTAIEGLSSHLDQAQESVNSKVADLKCFRREKEMRIKKGMRKPTEFMMHRQAKPACTHGRLRRNERKEQTVYLKK